MKIKLNLNLQILSLCSFVVSTCYDKYNQSINKKRKQSGKQQVNHENNDAANSMSDKDRSAVVVEILRELKICLVAAENVIGNLIFINFTIVH